MRIGTIADIPNLMAYYTMGNAVGTVLPDETGNYPGTLINAPATVPGRIGNALDFDPASTQYVDCGTAMGDAFGNNVSQFAVSFWFKADITTSSDGIFYIGDLASTQGEFHFAVGGNELRYRLSNRAFEEVYPFTDTENCHHAVIIYNGTAGIVYLDNNKIIDAPWSTDLNLLGLKAIIAAAYDNTFTFDGKIDQVRIYNGVPDAEQRSLLCNERPYPWVA